MLVEVARAAIADGDHDNAAERAEAMRRSLLQPVVNATGVLLHTNLGRAPLAVTTTGRASNIEFDLATGRRGSRSGHAGRLLALAVDAEAVLVVNNGAAAVMLVLAALARGRDVPVSRGELVEIGGGFRVPEVMAESGARLVEVGTTNRTRLADYERVAASAAVILKVHQSNYAITGFTEAVEVDALARLGPPVVVDLGSGLLDAATPWLDDPSPGWLANEPAVKQTLRAGASLVVFSGDKLLGGPQAGIIAGRSDLVAACAAHPFARAVRPGGLVLDALQEVALSYLRRDADRLPFWRMSTASVDALRTRARTLGVGEVVDTEAVTGGGTMPDVTIPSVGVALDGDHLTALRNHDVPVIARVREGRTICDLRTVDPDDDDTLASALHAVTN